MTNKTERTPQDAEAVAFLAVEQHCIVSPHLRGPDSKDFRRQLIAKYREAVERRVRAECAAKVLECYQHDDDPNHDGGEHRCHMCVEGDTILRIVAALEAQP